MVVVFFRLQWEFQWENGKNKMAKNHFSRVQNGSQSVYMGFLEFFDYFPTSILGVGAREKTKYVLKPVKQWEQLGNMHNWSLRNF